MTDSVVVPVDKAAIVYVIQEAPALHDEPHIGI
jgi:hypothetical protein